MLEKDIAAIRDSAGQALVEYVLVISLIALLAVTALAFVSSGINTIFTTIGTHI